MILAQQAGGQRKFLHVGENLNNYYFNQNRTLAGIVNSPLPKIDIAVLNQLIKEQQPVIETTRVFNSLGIIIFHDPVFRKR